MPKINVKDYLPLNSKEAIDKLLGFVKNFHVRMNDEEIGEVLQHISKIKLQLYFRTQIDDMHRLFR